MPARAYLLLVSFYTGQGVPPARLEALCGSPFAGMAVVYAPPYGHAPVDPAAAERRFRQAAAASGMHAWPWLFLNRIVGYSPAEGAPVLAERRYFRRIAGMDLFAGSEDRQAFLELWRGALRVARATSAPGVVLDLEAYNDPRAYRLSWLAEATGQDDETLVAALEALGAEMADIAAEEHPEAVVWTLFSGLAHRAFDGLRRGHRPLSVTHVVLGLLERAEERGLGLQVVSGGEQSLGYCHRDLSQLRRKIARREAAFAPVLARHKQVRLGATIAPWSDAALRRDWMLGGECAASRLVSAADFAPLFAELLRRHRFVWVYAAGAAHYDPYEPGPAEQIAEALGAALGAVPGPALDGGAP